MVALVMMTHTNTEAIEIIATDRDSSGIIRIAIEFSSARNCLVGAMERGHAWDGHWATAVRLWRRSGKRGLA